MKKKYIKCDGFDAGLLVHLDTVDNYIKEMIDLLDKMLPIMNKKPTELTEEEKNVFKRSSELVLLTTITKELNLK